MSVVKVTIASMLHLQMKIHDYVDYVFLNTLTLVLVTGFIQLSGKNQDFSMIMQEWKYHFAVFFLQLCLFDKL